jgi:hypothetical protein
MQSGEDSLPCGIQHTHTHTHTHTLACPLEILVPSPSSHFSFLQFLIPACLKMPSRDNCPPKQKHTPSQLDRSREPILLVFFGFLQQKSWASFVCRKQSVFQF